MGFNGEHVENMGCTENHGIHGATARNDHNVCICDKKILTLQALHLIGLSNLLSVIGDKRRGVDYKPLKIIQIWKLKN